MAVMKKVTIAVTLVAAVMIVLPGSVLAITGTASLSGPSNLDQGATGTITVDITASSIGAFELSVDVGDPSVIRFDSITSGSIAGASIFSSYTASTATISGFHTTGTTGGTVATIGFTAIGDPGTSSGISISGTMNEPTGPPYPPIDTTFTGTTVSINIPIPQHTLTMAVSPDGTGSVSPSSGDHLYDENQVVSISASPAEGWRFDHWVGNVANPNSASTTVTMDTDQSVTAVFTGLESFNLTISMTGQGSTIPGVGTYAHFQGQMVPLSATPAEGWRFDHWEGDVGDPNSPSTSVTMNSNQTVTAVFIKIPTFTLIMATNGQGQIVPAQGSYEYEGGTVVNIMATPAEGWRFINWTGDVADSNSPSTTVTINANKTVTANFSPLSSFSLTISVDGNGTTNPAAGTHTYDRDAVVTLTATPGENYRFDHWTGDVSDANLPTTTITINADKQVKAYFVSLTMYTLTIAVEGSGYTDPVPGTHEYLEGTTVAIEATPGTGQKFIGWSGDVADPYAASTTVVMNKTQTVTAHFEIQPEPPEFMRISVLLVTRNEAVLTWETDKPALGDIEFWPEGGQHAQVPVGSSFRTSYSMLLSDLAPGTTYHFIIVATDEGGKSTSSPENSFATEFTPAKFNIGNWQTITNEAGVTKTIELHATIANEGDLAGGYQVTLKVNGIVQQSGIYTLEPHTDRDIVFTATCSGIGDYLIDLNGFTMSVKVSGAVPSDEQKDLLEQIGDWLAAHWIPIAIVAGVLLVAIVVGIVMLRRNYWVMVNFIKR